MEEHTYPEVETVSHVDKPMKKPSSGAVWFVVIVVVLVALLFATSKKNKDTTVVPSENSETLCYYGSESNASGINSTYALKLAVVGDKATGELVTAPAEKDSMKGTLNGTISPSGVEQIFDGTYTNMAEGMNNIDQRIIRLTDINALVGYGDVTQNKDGSYSYTDVNNLTFSLKIPRVDCAVYDQAMAV